MDHHHRHAGLGLPSSTLLAAQQPDLRNPKTSSADVEAGGRIYRSHCTECHGRTGTGGRGPDLTTGRFRHGGSDSDLLRTIMKGIPGTEMPGVYMEDQQVWQIVSFVRSLSAQSSVQPTAGNVGEGEKLARGKGSGLSCHMVQGRGGRGGPDLSDVGGRRSLHFLRDALLDPDNEVDPAWWSYAAIPRSGNRVSGFKLNEDTWSFQMLDESGNLRSFAKSELAKIDVSRKSTMPAAGRQFSPADIDNLVAWLSQLRRK